jgi:hypothetical protein
VKLPDKPRFETTLHGNRGGGGYIYRYEDKATGAVAVVDRKTRRDPETISYSFLWLPGQRFASYDELRAALELLSDEAIAAEKARYPMVREKGPATCDRECRLCPSMPSMSPRDMGRRPPASVDVSLAVSPDAMADWFCGLCAEHEPLTEKPAELLERLQARLLEGAARRARILGGGDAG